MGAKCKTEIIKISTNFGVYISFKIGTSFVDLLCFFCLAFVMPLCASVYMCLVVTCWERADLFALVCGVLL